MSEQYDLVVAGGGVAGASLAGRVAGSGARVLVLERETEFRDRVRGEWVAPWGVDELETLGVLEVLRERANAHEVPLHWGGVGQMAPKPADLVTESTPKRAAVTFFHPNAQEALLGWAEEQGASIQRGARVTQVSGGERPTVEWSGDEAGTASARLVVGAEGRTSMVRTALGHEELSYGDTRYWAGARLKNLDWPGDTSLLMFEPTTGYVGSIFPQQDGAARVYLGTERGTKRMSGTQSLEPFLAGLNRLLGDRDVFAQAEQVGPLASFDVEMRWVPHPAEGGLAAIGDAAGYTDPTFGQGLSLALRDARVLSDALLESGDWVAAADGYATQHDRYFDAVVQKEIWMEEVFLAPGEEAQETRRRAFGAWSQDPSRNLGHSFDAPDFTPDEETRRRYFGLDLE